MAFVELDLDSVQAKTISVGKVTLMLYKIIIFSRVWYPLFETPAHFFPVKFATFFRTLILNNSCERLLLKTSKELNITLYRLI